MSDPLKQVFTINNTSFVFDQKTEHYLSASGIRIKQTLLHNLNGQDKIYFAELVTLLDSVIVDNPDFIISITSYPEQKNVGAWRLNISKADSYRVVTVSIHLPNVDFTDQTDPEFDYYIITYPVSNSGKLDIRLKQIYLSTLPKNIGNIGLMIKIYQNINVEDNIKLLLENLYPDVLHPVRLLTSPFCNDANWDIGLSYFSFNKCLPNLQTDTYKVLAYQLYEEYLKLRVAEKTVQNNKQNVINCQKKLVDAKQKLSYEDANLQQINCEMTLLQFKIQEVTKTKEQTQKYQACLKQIKEQTIQLKKYMPNIIIKEKELQETEKVTESVTENVTESVTENVTEQALQHLIDNFKNQHPIIKSALIESDETIRDFAKGRSNDEQTLLIDFVSLSRSQQELVISGVFQ